MAVPVSELQTPNIDNIVELFQLELNTTMHGVSQTYYFHNGVGINNDANQYLQIMNIQECLLRQKGLSLMVNNYQDLH